MKQVIKTKVMVLLFIMAAPLLSYGQYLNKLYDYDTTQDWGWNIFLNTSSSYFISGDVYDPAASNWSVITMHISGDGSTVTDKRRHQLNNAGIYSGDPAQAKMLLWGGYLSPFTVQWPNPITSYLYSAAGFMKLDALGDILFTKTYTDTSLHYDIMIACAVLPNGDYIGGGARGLNTPSVYPALIVRTDSSGDTLWTHTYQKNPGEWAEVHSVAPLNGGRILAGAATIHQVVLPNTLSYNHNAPWFMVLDSAGHILKDTVYSSGFTDFNSGGAIYPDKNGGYIHLGDFDSLFTAYPTDAINFPSYIMHLDTNFRVTWITDFPYNPQYGHLEKCTVKQLRDSNYVVIGDCRPPIPPLGPVSTGWAAKVDRNGNILWIHTYTTDTAEGAECYLRDGVELPNGHLVFIGAGFNDSLPSWHQGRDVWLLEVDENGCEVPGCALKAPPGLPKGEEMLRVWPNPTRGDVTIEAPVSGTFTVYTMIGQEVKKYAVPAGQTSMQLPATLATGMYMGYFKPDDGSKTQEVKLVYQP